MATNKLIPLAVGAAMALGSASAHATPFYFDVGVDHGTNGTQHAGPTTTGLLNEILFRYDSTTYFEDTNGDGVYSVGDMTRGTGGILNEPQFGVGDNTPQRNQISGFEPGLSAPSDPSRNGFGTEWLLTFGWNDLVAEVNPFGGLTYTSGTIEFYYYDFGDFANRVNFMNLSVIEGGINEIGQSLDLTAEVSFAGLDGDTAVAGTTIAEFIRLEDGTSFYDYVMGGETEILTLIDQNTSPFWVNGVEGDTPVLGSTAYDDEGNLILSGQHDGSIVFNVPEPSAVGLIGAGVLALGLVAGFRRRSDGIV